MTNAEARFNKSHIRKVYACLAVTCHLQNDRDFLRATVVTRGWNGYRNKSQHRKSTLEKKILPPFQQGFEPATFQSRVRRSNHWAIPAPLRGNDVWIALYTLWNALFTGVEEVLSKCGVREVSDDCLPISAIGCCFPLLVGPYPVTWTILLLLLGNFGC